MSLNYVLRAKKFNTKKSLGQNFLVDENIISFIADCVNSTDEILEIGPGAGFVTEQFVKRAKKVVAVEIDKDAVSLLTKNLGSYSNFHLIEKDILKTSIDELPFSADKIKVVANIPYYITSPILAHLLGEIDELTHPFRDRISEIILMVQLEVAKRIVANENSANKEYGQLSILSQMYADTEIIKLVPKDCFMPKPKVDSALVRFKINSKPKVEVDKNLKRTVRALFMSRRKNIKNSLSVAGFLNVVEAIKNAGLDETIRGEKLSLAQISLLSKELLKVN